MFRRLGIVVLAALFAACGHHSKKSCDPTAQSGCATGQVCESVQGGSPACFAPLIVRGTVSDLSTSAALSGARAVALDASGSPLSRVAVTATDGAFSLTVPAERDSSGKPIASSITLRADAQGYQTFPGGVRTALPIDLSTATFDSGANDWVITSTLTALKLLALTSGGQAYIHGNVAKPPSGAGRLVVAEPAPGGAGPGTGLTGVADTDGNYAIFNLAVGTSYVVTAYTKGANYTPVTTATLATGDNAVDTIALSGGTGMTLSGGLIFNNSPPNLTPSVTLAVQSTYDTTLDRGYAPPGLTVTGDTNGYTFTGVPDGKYQVLAAFTLDGDVRNISGTGNTGSPAVTIAGGTCTAGCPLANFKIIPAVQLDTIDGVAVSATPVTLTTANPVFAWTTTSVDSSSQTYDVWVYYSTGLTAMHVSLGASSGQNTVKYVGPALVRGEYYQLRIYAIANGGAVDSYTEDVAGVFTY